MTALLQSIASETGWFFVITWVSFALYGFSSVVIHIIRKL